MLALMGGQLKVVKNRLLRLQSRLWLQMHFRRYLCRSAFIESIRSNYIIYAMFCMLYLCDAP